MTRCAADGLAAAVVFTGHRDDVPDVLASMDVAVQCSLSENYGGTIEALLMERPTVATRVGGMPETVRQADGSARPTIGPRGARRRDLPDARGARRGPAHGAGGPRAHARVLSHRSDYTASIAAMDDQLLHAQAPDHRAAGAT